jgi:hypothetical protein
MDAQMEEESKKGSGMEKYADIGVEDFLSQRSEVTVFTNVSRS